MLSPDVVQMAPIITVLFGTGLLDQDHGRQAHDSILTLRPNGFQCHVASTLNGPFIVLFGFAPVSTATGPGIPAHFTSAFTFPPISRSAGPLFPAR
jgi:hypothetical protein